MELRGGAAGRGGHAWKRAWQAVRVQARAGRRRRSSPRAAAGWAPPASPRDRQALPLAEAPRARLAADGGRRAGAVLSQWHAVQSLSRGGHPEPGAFRAAFRAAALRPALTRYRTYAPALCTRSRSSSRAPVWSLVRAVACGGRPRGAAGGRRGLATAGAQLALGGDFAGQQVERASMPACLDSAPGRPGTLPRGCPPHWPPPAASRRPWRDTRAPPARCCQGSGSPRRSRAPRPRPPTCAARSGM